MNIQLQTHKQPTIKKEIAKTQAAGKQQTDFREFWDTRSYLISQAKEANHRTIDDKMGAETGRQVYN